MGNNSSKTEMVDLVPAKEYRAIQKQVAYEYPYLSELNESMLVTDNRKEDCPIVIANDDFERMTLHPKEVILGVNCRFLQGPLTNKETVGQIRMACNEGRPLRVEILNYRRDAVPFWNVFTMLPVHKKGKKTGKVEYFIAIQKDVSGLKGLSKEVMSWSAEEVGMWLETRALGFCVSRFIRAGIDGRALMQMDDEELTQHGFNLRSDRKRLLDAIQEDFDVDCRYVRSIRDIGSLQPDMQGVTEMDITTRDELWSRGSVGTCDANRVAIKCFFEGRTPVVLLIDPVEKLSQLRRSLKAELGEKFQIRHRETESGEWVELTSSKVMNAVFESARGRVLPLQLHTPTCPADEMLLDLISCIPHPVVFIDAFHMVSYANDDARQFCQGELVGRPVEEWLQLPEGKQPLHYYAGVMMNLEVSKPDDTVEMCQVKVQLYSPGFAVVSFAPVDDDSIAV